MTDRERQLIKELNGRVCRCSRAKGAGMTFCTHCYFSLPRRMRRALYKRVGEGYAENYDEAVAFMLKRELPEQRGLEL
jgi:hypothetical protein